MAIVFPEGTQEFRAGIIKSEIQPWTSRTTYSTTGNWQTVVSGSYIKVSGTGNELLVTLNIQYYGEVHGAGNMRLVIGGSTYYGQHQWGGYGGYERVSTHTFRVTSLASGTHSWIIAMRHNGFSLANPSSSDSSYIEDSSRGPSTIHFLEEAF